METCPVEKTPLYGFFLSWHWRALNLRLVFSLFLHHSEFKNDFLELLRRRFGLKLPLLQYSLLHFIALVHYIMPISLFCLPEGTKRVHNNIIYNEYISHREHVHMNSTQWETLTDFTKWLGREGKPWPQLHTPEFCDIIRLGLIKLY